MSVANKAGSVSQVPKMRASRSRNLLILLAAGAALVVVTAAHSGSLDTGHPTITGYGKLTAALLRS